MDPKEYFKMDLNAVHEHEYDAQLLGFTLQDFMRAIKVLVKDEVTRYTGSITASLLKKYTDQDDPEIEQVKEIAKTLINQYICASVEPLKTLENQLKDLLHIPPHVLLPKDEAQKNQYSVRDEEEIDEQIEDLMKRIKRTKSFDVELRQELKMLRDVLPQLNRQVRELEQLDQSRVECENMFQQLEPVIDSINNGMQQICIDKEE